VYDVSITMYEYYCIRACLRDEHECFMSSFAKQFVGIPEIAEAEAWGVRETLHWPSIIDIWKMQLLKLKVTACR
jgi:hypothetical protein